MTTATTTHPQKENATAISQDTIPMVSVFCITYNHGRFIAQTLEGFLMQRTNFTFEVIIGDDCSTDGTTEIIQHYASKYPDIIKRLDRPHNIGPNQNSLEIAKNMRGKYVAACDGDDFWTDPNKLQKQIDFLENNPEYIICCHYTKEIAGDGTLLFVPPKVKPLVHTYSDLLVNKQTQTSTASVVYRNEPQIRKMFLNDWFMEVVAADKFLRLYATWSSGKKIYVMPEIMSCYRKHAGGLWSATPPIPLKKRQLSDFQKILSVFSFTPAQKVRTSYFYLTSYFGFEVKHFGWKQALSTLGKLLFNRNPHFQR